MALVVDSPGAGEDVFTNAAELARDDDIWKSRRLDVDGQMVTGYETVYEGMWVAYCSMPAVILYVLAPVAMRPETVELRTLGASEVTQREDWPT
jgi:hypothetical protein